MTMTADDRALPRAVDVPADVPAATELGRLQHLDEAMRRFDPDLVRSMCEHCLQADELAYAAFLEFRSKEHESGWRMFEQALERGIDAVDGEPGPALVALFEQLDRVPDWVDFDQLHRGAVAMWRAGPLVPMVFAYSTIAVGFTNYAASRPVLFSGRMISRDQVGQRLVESFRWIAKAHSPGLMRRDQDGFKHTARVRMIHATVRHVLSRSPEWDWADWGIPINNFDAMDTQGGQFGVEVVDSLAKAGVKLDDRERADLFALTRYIGYVMGVPEDILHIDEDDARVKHALHQLLETPADEGCRQITKGIIDYGCEESLGGYDVMPPGVARFMTVERRKKLSYGLLTAWQPPDIVEQLGIEPDAWRFVLPVARPFVRAHDLVTRRFSPHKDEARAQKVLDEFEVAIAIGDDPTPLAEPEQLAVAVDRGARAAAELAGKR